MKKLSLQTCVLITTTIIALISFSWNINSWKFSFVGDEWQFYKFAQFIVSQHFLISPFNMQGVYGENPALGSIYQAVFLQLLGDSNFAWRFSNIILIIPSSIFFYLWIKKLFNAQLALISTILLQSSFFVSNYFKIGYVNPQSFALFLASLYAATLLAEHISVKRMIFLGVTLGVSFYIYLGPLFPFFIWPMLLPLIRYKKKLFPSIFFGIASYILLLLPGLFDMNHWNDVKKTIFVKEFHDNTQILINIFHNFLLYYKSYDFSYNHFIEGPYLDPISRILALLGIIIITIKSRKEMSHRLLLLTYLSVVIVIGVTSPYTNTATTRGIFFIPFGCIFAAFPLAYFFHKKIYTVLLVPIFIEIFLINFYQSQLGVFQKTGYTATALILKEMQHKKDINQHAFFLLVNNQQTFSINNIPTLQKAYGLENITLTTIAPEKLNCHILRNSTTLFFANDQIAKYTAHTFSCLSKDNVFFKELSPGIFL